MKITFLGAAHEVTGSCTLLQAGDKNILVDCGMEQGRDTFENQKLPVNPGLVDYVLLTHAHIDHSGDIPLLYKNGFKGKIFATGATVQLCGIMLRDCAHIQQSEAEYKNRKSQRAGGQKVEPIYDMNDVEGVLPHFVPCSYGEEVEVCEGVRIRFGDVGHLLGSAFIEVWITEGFVTKKLVFSGDIGNVNQPILRDPHAASEADYVVIEGTYGDKLHDAPPDYISILAACIQRALDRGGNVVIPSFAVGRTQSLLYFMREIKERGLVKGHDGFPVYVDSPLAIEATEIFKKCDISYLDSESARLIRSGINPLVFPGLRTTPSSDESKAINFDSSPKVIISASGMCEAGRIRHHLKHNLWRPESLVLFVGYQAAGTLGRIICDGAQKVKLFGEEIAIKAEVTYLPGISGHADQAHLLGWLRTLEKKPEMVFVNHGESSVVDFFAAKIKADLGFEAFAPHSGTAFDLLSNSFVKVTKGIPVKPRAAVSRSPVFARLLATGEKLLDVIKESEGMANKELAKFADQLDALIVKWRN